MSLAHETSNAPPAPAPNSSSRREKLQLQLQLQLQCPGHAASTRALSPVPPTCHCQISPLRSAPLNPRRGRESQEGSEVLTASLDDHSIISLLAVFSPGTYLDALHPHRIPFFRPITALGRNVAKRPSDALAGVHGGLLIALTTQPCGSAAVRGFCLTFLPFLAQNRSLPCASLTKGEGRV